MSGVELAGLVLAVVPVILVASEYHSKLLDPTRTVFLHRRKSIKLATFFSNLHYEVSMLNITIQSLIHDLYVLPEAHRTRLLSDEQDPSYWQEEAVVRALRSRLGLGFDAFREALDEILRNLGKLVKDDTLDIETSLNEIQTPRTSYAKLLALREQFKADKSPEHSRFLDRLKFVIREEKRNAYLDRIEKCNERLDSLLQRSSATYEKTKANQARPESTSTPHMELRPLMHALYSTMGGLWPCSCPHGHEARFCLLKCQDNTPSKASQEVYFDMLMSIRAQATAQYQTWLESKMVVALANESTKKTSNVRFIIEDEDSVAASPTTPSVIEEFMGRASTMDSDTSGTRTPTGTRPRRTTYPDPDTWTTQRPLAYPRRASAPPLTKEQVSDPDEFCKIIRAAGEQKCCPRMLYDGTQIWHITRPSEKRLCVEGSLPDVSLAALLDGKRKLKLKEKRILAVILAHSLLHFCDSPWMRHGTRSSWNKHHISFFYKSKDDVDLIRPYVTTDFQPIQDREDPAEAMYRLHPNPSVLALGVLLLEIEQQAGIESKRENDDLTAEKQEHVNSDLLTALRLFGEQQDDVYEGFHQAIDACLNCQDYFQQFDTEEMDLENDDFREAVYNEIVAPLELELLNGFGVTIDKLGLNGPGSHHPYSGIDLIEDIGFGPFLMREQTNVDL
ncbi:hypothetical protein P152DRAFT_451168 [Eremomyces bilateralis CBS 781.70]|uniref:DUF7580 domain-containing protein n=1 Tax=Eremomyces bilateralis CBS 781.70 TaxID=1392243 RepID=A0A6G1FXB8_9PEZI|nr:uncharacterized protein P152DRAFT_451168 [Eremomyces bilateralis CBS 781.70]KAF1810424.1 hypothetical protein P152DRAFT_451168 [Eremomyces bilateralis CBS 781.70]